MSKPLSSRCRRPRLYALGLGVTLAWGVADAASAAGRKAHKAPPAQPPAADAVPDGAVTLAEVLARAEHAAPSIAARKAQENIAAADVGVAKAQMLPQIDAEAVDSLGFPGSTGYLGIGGVMGSPYRSGLAGGFVLQQQVYDFGRTDAAVDVANQDTAAKRQLTKLEVQSVRLNALRRFYDCSRLRSEVTLAKELVDKTASVTKEVKSFVRTGQRSIVDRYLAEAQLEEVQTDAAVAEARLGEAQKTLALIVGTPGQVLVCPPLAATDVNWTQVSSPEQNPLVAAAAADLATEQARLDVVKTRYMPKLNVLGTVGYLEKTRFVPKTPYAVGLGVSVPVFDGFKEDYEIERSQATIDAKRFEVDARKLDLAELNARYDEEIAAARSQLDHLTGERKLAGDGFDVARDRYRSAQGSLTDLREAIRNLARTDQTFNAATASELEAVGAKELVNGSEPRG